MHRPADYRMDVWGIYLRSSSFKRRPFISIRRLIMIPSRISRPRIIQVLVILIIFFTCVIFRFSDQTYCEIYRHPTYQEAYKRMGKTVPRNVFPNFQDISISDIDSYVISQPKMKEFSFRLNPNVCGESKVVLLIVVPSKPSNVHERQAVRDTWGAKPKIEPGLRLVFLTGLADDKSNRQLASEYQLYKDVVQASFEDSYKNLTLKTSAMLQWKKEFCPQARFMMKADDDMFVNVSNLLRLLYSLKQEKRFILGYPGIDEEPLDADNESKWYVKTKDYPFKKYPPYAHGPAYVISSDLVSDLHALSLHTPRIHLEDVYVTGLCAQVARASHVGRCGFEFSRQTSFVWFFSDSVVAVHDYSPDQIRTLWRRLEYWKQFLPLLRVFGWILGY